MGFKLGKSNKPTVYNGEVKSKLFFNKEETSIPGTPILRKNLKGSVLAEANDDGSIFVDHKLVPGSEKEKQVLMHEMVHLTDMKTGKLSYTDNSITWNGETYNRKNGKIYYNNDWVPEGSGEFPWEQMPWE